jgi:hypothetical protein
MPALAARVELDELIALFAGVLDEYEEWITTPYPTVPLTVELCKRIHPSSESGLRIAMYGAALPVEKIPTRCRDMIAIGYARWVQMRRPWS